MRRKAIAMLAVAVAGCSGEVAIQSTSGSGTGGSETSSSSTSSSSSGTGGSGGSCSVSLPAGCGCPDEGANGWLQTFTVLGADGSTHPAAVGALPIAPDGSTVLRVQVHDGNGDSGRLARMDAAGNVLWNIPGDASWTPTPDPRDCSTVVTGGISGGTTNLLGQAVSCSTAYCPFVARIDAGGSPEWIKVYDFGGDAWTTPVIAGVLPDGRIALAGPFESGTLDLGTGPIIAPPAPGSGVFVAMLSSTGEALWTRHFTKENTSFFLAAAVVSSAGDITTAASAEGDVDFGQGPIAVLGASPDHGGLALASWDATGTLRFGKALGSSGFASYPTLSLGSAGRVIVTQVATGGIDYGGGPIGADPAASITALAAFDANGQYLWSTGIDGQSFSVPGIDAADHVWLGVSSGAIAELDALGSLVTKHSLGGSGARSAWTIGFTPNGAPIAAGTFDDTLDLGEGPITAQSKHDTFVARLAP